jgi:hypothetical protein
LEDAKMDKTKAIGAAVSHIEKQFGKGSIMRMGDEPPRKVDVISTGALALDLALGVGGVPKVASSKFTALSRVAKLPSPCTSSPRPRRPAALPRS